MSLSNPQVHGTVPQQEIQESKMQVRTLSFCNQQNADGGQGSIPVRSSRAGRPHGYFAQFGLALFLDGSLQSPACHGQRMDPIPMKIH